MVLPIINNGDKVIYENEHEGIVVDIKKPLGYNQYTVKLLNGFTRICARYQICQIDHFFHESGITDWDLIDEMMKTPEITTTSDTAPVCMPAHTCSNPDRSISPTPGPSRGSSTSTYDNASASNINTAEIPTPSGSTSTPLNPAPRFQDINNDDVRAFIRQNENANTAAKTAAHVNLLKDYLKSKGETRELHRMPPKELNSYLSCYFVAIRCKNGQDYEPSSLRGMLGSFNRHLSHMDYGFSLLESIEFTGMREALKSKQKQLKKMGKGNRDKKSEALTDEEIDILYDKGQLGTHNPAALLNTVWFNNCIYFGLRGGKGEHRNICWGDVTLKTDSSGREYIELTERQTKTRTGDDIQNYREKTPKAWANLEHQTRCPVFAYKRYAEKRPQQYSKESDPFYIATITNNANPKEFEQWFMRQPVGVNKLCSLMSRMSKAAGLSSDKKLTNHSARKYLVQKLSDSNVPPTHIMQVTGHKNINSINNYSEISDNNQRVISNILSGKPSSPANIQPYQSVPKVSNHKSTLKRTHNQSTNSYTSTEENTSAGKLFQNCHINSITINTYDRCSIFSSPPRKRRPYVVYSDSESQSQ